MYIYLLNPVFAKKKGEKKKLNLFTLTLITFTKPFSLHPGVLIHRAKSWGHLNRGLLAPLKLM